MASLRVDLFCEDSGHEQFVRALITRLGCETHGTPLLRTRCARGGRGTAVSEFKTFQRVVQEGSVRTPDLLVVVIDGNCGPWHEKVSEIEQAIDSGVFPRDVVGCPDPHIERWYLADPVSFQTVIGTQPAKDPGKCERDLYKHLLRQAIEQAELPILTNETEFAGEIVDAMDLFRAGKQHPSLKHFVDGLRQALKGDSAADPTPQSRRNL